MRTGTDWFELWFDDKQSMIETMVKNMQSDYECGYEWFGHSLTKQREELDEYKRKFDEQMEAFKYMEDKQVNRWCYYDLKKRGAIA
jgi:hypothetical protein